MRREVYGHTHSSKADADLKSHASTEVYLSPTRRRDELETPYFDFSYEPVPQKTVSVLNRPPRTASRHTEENFDAHHQRDNQAFERHANIYRSHAHEAHHHNKPINSVPTLWEQGHIVDKGRGRRLGLTQDSNILVPDAQSWEQRQTAPQPTMSSSGMRADKQLQQQQGRYNPLTHEYTQPVDPVYHAQRQKEFERNTGLRGKCITQQHIASSPVNLHLSQVDYRPTSTLQSGAEWVGTVGGAPSGGRVAPSTPGLAGGAGRNHHMGGDSWGTYDPISHTWRCPPADARYEDQGAVLNRQMGIGGASLSKVSSSTSHGVYNPILNSWTVPPADPREARGLSFAPASMFSAVNPSSIRS